MLLINNTDFTRNSASSGGGLWISSSPLSYVDVIDTYIGGNIANASSEANYEAVFPQAWVEKHGVDTIGGSGVSGLEGWRLGTYDDSEHGVAKTVGYDMVDGESEGAKGTKHDAEKVYD